MPEYQESEASTTSIGAEYPQSENAVPILQRSIATPYGAEHRAESTVELNAPVVTSQAEPTVELNAPVEASCFEPTVEPEALVEANSNAQINSDFRATRDRARDVGSLIQAPVVRSQPTGIEAYRRSGRALKRRKFFDEEATLALLVRAEPEPELSEPIEPIEAISVEDAMREDAPSWLEAVDSELQSLKECKTYIVVAELPDQKQSILSI